MWVRLPAVWVRQHVILTTRNLGLLVSELRTRPHHVQRVQQTDLTQRGFVMFPGHLPRLRDAFAEAHGGLDSR